jgi:hypothetical protein
MNQENQVPSPGAGPSPDAVPVTPAQIEQLCSALAAEPDPVKQRHYWALLQQSAPSSKALDLALTCIMNPSAPNRGEAVRYLRICFPDRLPALHQAFAKDPDEDLRYQLSEFLRDSDQDAAVGMKIGMLKTATPAMQETLVKEISELGNLFHLEALQGLSAIAGGSNDSPFARAASLLAQRTRSQSAGAS